MKKAELIEKSNKELEKILEEKTEELQKLRFDLSFNRLKDISSVKKVKRELARVRTLLNRK